MGRGGQEVRWLVACDWLGGSLGCWWGRHKEGVPNLRHPPLPEPHTFGQTLLEGIGQQRHAICPGMRINRSHPHHMM